MRLDEYELKARKKLMEAGVDSPGLCSRILAAFAAGLSKTEYVLHSDQELPPGAADLLEELVERRSRGEPLAYILGKKEFYSLEFAVSPATLTPRPETELLVDLANDLPLPTGCLFADAGCGSGCIGLSLLKLHTGWRGILLDTSRGALEITRKNADRLGCSPVLLEADLFHLPLAEGSFDLIISNPPYIAEAERKLVMPETLAYEPHSALFSSANGMDHIRGLVRNAAKCLKPDGYLLLEHGAGQAGATKSALLHAGFTGIEDFNDLAGLPRCTKARKK